MFIKRMSMNCSHFWEGGQREMGEKEEREREKETEWGVGCLCEVQYCTYVKSGISPQ